MSKEMEQLFFIVCVMIVSHVGVFVLGMMAGTGGSHDRRRPPQAGPLDHHEPN